MVNLCVHMEPEVGVPLPVSAGGGVCRRRVLGAVTAPGGCGGRRILKGSSKVQHYNSVQKNPNKYSHYLDANTGVSGVNPT